MFHKKEHEVGWCRSRGQGRGRVFLNIECALFEWGVLFVLIQMDDEWAQNKCTGNFLEMGSEEVNILDPRFAWVSVVQQFNNI